MYWINFATAVGFANWDLLDAMEAHMAMQCFGGKEAGLIVAVLKIW